MAGSRLANVHRPNLAAETASLRLGRSRPRGALVAIDPVGILGIAAAIGLWYLASLRMGSHMPSPRAVFANAVQHFSASGYLTGIGLPSGGYLPHLVYTVVNVLIGVGLGAAVGIALGLLSAQWDAIDQITLPLVTIFGTVPILIAAPFFLMWFGIVPLAQIILVTFFTAIVLQVFTRRAVENVPPKYLEYAATLGAQPGLVFRRVMLPAVLPEVFGGLRIAFAAAWGLEAISELLGAQAGVGRAIYALAAVFDLTGVMAIIVLLGIVAIVFDALLVRLRQALTQWSEAGRRV
jgi:ABC-type nitrate/sulfonate/bicarbonate transport system permease component